jgi:6-phosphofructokinase 1
LDLSFFDHASDVFNSGCQAFIIREGWEGLVRGNVREPTPNVSARASAAASPLIRPHNGGALTSAFALDTEDEPYAAAFTDINTIAPLSDAPLSFGYGGLLRDGAGEGDPEDISNTFAQHQTIENDEDDGRTLKDRYIVRVGWDDVRGWLGEGGTLIGSSRCPSCGWDAQDFS